MGSTSTNRGGGNGGGGGESLAFGIDIGFEDTAGLNLDAYELDLPDILFRSARFES